MQCIAVYDPVPLLAVPARPALPHGQQAVLEQVMVVVMVMVMVMMMVVVVMVVVNHW